MSNLSLDRSFNATEVVEQNRSRYCGPKTIPEGKQENEWHFIILFLWKFAYLKKTNKQK